MSLTFDKNCYVSKSVTCDGMTLNYRAYENIPYCENPADAAMQRLSIFVNEAQIGGYMPGPIAEPGPEMFRPETSATFFALLHGYIVVPPASVEEG